MKLIFKVNGFSAKFKLNLTYVLYIVKTMQITIMYLLYYKIYNNTVPYWGYTSS